MISGLSKWTYELKKPSKDGGIDYVESKPLLCDCGGSTPIGGDGADSASYFYISFEYICSSCGRVLEPLPRKEEDDD